MDEFSSLHCTLLTLLPPRSLCNFTSHRTWLCLMLKDPCPCFLHPASGLDLASFPLALPPSLCLLPADLCGLASVTMPPAWWPCWCAPLSWRFLPIFPVKGFFLFVGSFSWSDVRSWDRDVVCVQVVKPELNYTTNNGPKWETNWPTRAMLLEGPQIIYSRWRITMSYI